MTDWARVERALDDQDVAHGCAFCGGVIPQGDSARWGLAVRRLDGHTSVVWMHSTCFIEHLHPSVQRTYLPGGPAAPPI